MSAAAESPSEAAPGSGFFHELLRRRYRYRQATGIAYAVLIVVLADVYKTPVADLVLVGAVFAVLGMIVRMWASGHVKKDQVLAISGPYAYVRHPLYVGNHLIAIGLCLASGLWWSLPVWIAMALFFYPSTIRREDSRLSKRFPEAWGPWRATTHALIPRLRPHRTDDKGEWSLKQSLVQNGEPLYVLGIAAMLVHLWRLA
jgi:protein-S-isoprenylcysteine O-methyltransferase Ste14